jgi:hypothetical protein
VVHRALSFQAPASSAALRGLLGALLLLGGPLAGGRALRAELVRVDITSREPHAGGRPFGERGPYERLRGKAFFEVDPESPGNQAVVDLDLAPRNARGRVEFSADLEILAPRDLSRSNGAVFYEVNNRGNRTSPGVVAGGAEDFFFARGFIVAWSGWIAELLPGGGRLRLEAPVATAEGKPITGLVRAEMCPDAEAERLPISHWPNHGSYEPTARGEREAALTWRLREKDRRVAIPRLQWRLEKEWVEADGERSLLPRIDLVVSGGFAPGGIYELVYEAEGPIVQGLGFAGIRDLISCFKHVRDERNPLRLEGGAPAVRLAYGFGTSQSGRALRQFLHDGFNADESSRQVFDGVIPHVAGGGLGSFNHRFASPTRHNAQHDSHLYPADVFPFAYGDGRDPLSGRSGGILRRARETGAVPKVFHTQSSSEYWHRAGSLVHTDPLGERDAEIPPEVRIYTFGGTQHGPGSGLPEPRRPGSDGQLPSNPADYRPLLRALVVALDAWVRDGVEPPPSVYPRIADGTLAGWRVDESGWRPLPGVRYPEVIHAPELLDRGPEWERHRRAALEPPVSRGVYGVKVPACGADGNERGTLLLPCVAVPVATYTSWNLRGRSLGAETELLSLRGGYIPFARDAAARQAAGDPRPALLEAYRSFEDYLERYRRAARDLTERRYLLEEDLPALEALAGKRRALFE